MSVTARAALPGGVRVRGDSEPSDLEALPETRRRCSGCPSRAVRFGRSPGLPPGRPGGSVPGPRGLGAQRLARRPLTEARRPAVQLEHQAGLIAHRDAVTPCPSARRRGRESPSRRPPGCAGRSLAAACISTGKTDSPRPARRRCGSTASPPGPARRSRSRRARRRGPADLRLLRRSTPRPPLEP